MDALTTGQFLKQFFRYAPDGFIELYFMIPKGLTPPRGGKWQYGQYAPLPLNRDIPDSIPSVSAANSAGYGVYFGVTPSREAFTKPVLSEKTGKPYQPRRREKHVDWLLALWADLDNTTLEAAEPTLMGWQYKPTLVVKSGGGIHAYWLLSEPMRVTEDNKPHIKKVLHGVARAHGQSGGDAAVRDLARIMRLPGTVNTKPGRNGARCEVAYARAGTMPFRLLERQFAPYMPRELPTVQRHIELPAQQELPPVTRKFINEPPTEGNRNRSLYAAARGCNDAGMSQSEAERLLSAVAHNIGLDEHETLATISSAYRAARSPITSNPAYLRIAIRDRRMNNA